MGTWEQIAEWPYWWNAATTLIRQRCARHLLAKSSADRRADEQVHWSVEMDGNSAHVRNEGPADDLTFD